MPLAKIFNDQTLLIKDHMNITTQDIYKNQQQNKSYFSN